MWKGPAQEVLLPGFFVPRIARKAAGAMLGACSKVLTQHHKWHARVNRLEACKKRLG
jgi:hypothetical protein